MILVAPTEPEEILALLAARGLLAVRSSLPEKHGADYEFAGQPGSICVQRKAMPDLLGSVGDGRLQWETSLLRDQAVGIVMVEGSIESAGRAAEHGGGWDKRGIRNIMHSVMAQEGLIVDRTDNLPDTAERLEELIAYWSKPAHQTLLTRPRMPRAARTGDRRFDEQMHLIQGFRHVGPVLAANIISAFDGIPLAWTVSQQQLAAVERLGEKTAKDIFEFLGGSK